MIRVLLADDQPLVRAGSSTQANRYSTWPPSSVAGGPDMATELAPTTVGGCRNPRPVGCGGVVSRGAGVAPAIGRAAAAASLATTAGCWGSE